MNLFHLDWPVDLHGYHIDAPAPAATSRSSRVLSGDTGPRIVRNGGGLDVRQPFQIPGLCRRLAEKPRTAEGALEFVTLHGFLFKASARAESVAEVLEAMDAARRLVAAVDAKNWSTISRWLSASGQDNELFVHGGVGRLGVQFVVDPKAERPALRLRPANLFQAALVQALDEAAIGKPLRKCRRPGCPEYFTYGHGTGRRETARYCSPRCKDAHAYERRKDRP